MGRPKTRFCDCGEYVTTLGSRFGSTKEHICDRCYELDGKTSVEQHVIGELRMGPVTVEAAVTEEFSYNTIYEALERLRKRGRVVRDDTTYRLGDHAWDTTPVVDFPKASHVKWEWLEETPVIPEGFEWEGGHVVSGPIGDARFPGRRFRYKPEAREYYRQRFDIIAECRLHPQRYIFRVDHRREYPEGVSARGEGTGPWLRGPGGYDGDG